jgi:hypothetical protein
MPPEETQDETPAVEVNVEVVADTTEDAPPADDSPDVVVVNTEGGDAVDAVVVEAVIEQARDLAAVEAIALEALQVAREAMAAAQTAMIVADEPIVDPIPEPVIEEAVEEDEAPDTEHGFYKRGSLFGITL